MLNWMKRKLKVKAGKSSWLKVLVEQQHTKVIANHVEKKMLQGQISLGVVPSATNLSL